MHRQVEVRVDGRGLEAAARQARYAVFEDLVEENEVLFLAHHADDQIETFFQRLMRGAGTHGLRGMPQSRTMGRGQLFRPVLDIPRSGLEKYAHQHGLEWVEDDSNNDLSLDRNFLRREVLPLLESRWPGYRESLGHSMVTMEEAELDLESIVSPLLVRAEDQLFGEPTLDLYELGNLESHTLGRVLRYWIRGQGMEPPGRIQLREFIRQLASGDSNAAPRLRMGSHCLERFQHRLHIRACTDLPEGEWQLSPGETLRVPGMGELSSREIEAGGVRLPDSGYWLVKLRAGGERCQPAGRAHSRSLKKLLQDYAVPPWWRERLPLLHEDDQMLAVANLWVCEGALAGEGETGYEIGWKPNP